MAVTGIRARFPLGVYVGHRPDGSPDALPSTLRLHAALVAAASRGSTADVRGATLARRSSITRALEWIEDNPPEFVELPPVRENANVKEFAFRDEGVVENVSKSPMRRKTPRAVGTGTAISAPIGWGWADVPADVAEALATLCEDVPCLGEAHSPVILEFGEIAPTHRRSSRVSPFAPADIRIATPVSGRLCELDELHAEAHPHTPPAPAKDRWKETEQPSAPPISHNNAVDIGYNPIDTTNPPAAPWRHVIHISIDTPIPNSERVGWSIALHRAMVAALDTDASSVITGRYAPGTAPEANRVAIQPIDAAVMSMSRHPHLGAGIAILVPNDALEITNRALRNVTRLYRRDQQPILLGQRTIVDAATFWQAPGPGVIRVWESLPAVMPETRRPRRPRRRAWTLAESAQLSVGFVFRDQLPHVSARTAEERYAATVDAVESRGVRAVVTSPLPDADVRKYAHKMPDGVVAQPYRLHLLGGSLLPDQALIAIGQSRHLGCGLLCPIDRPESLVESWGVTE
ncbi:type I-U CRISPR-associated protein Cas5/Cas6 [Mycolicibacterium agri]|uniref:Type I-U CRISPR-associated protein Cas5/Cas6 n=1 Tax=Mycolicibacterium agri TaxID=36811 RepID=A0A2A7MR04_MYCAG|nr:type I-U CRISPR-associated protein Cas5/Cas6 [Mycolicibacterium agri]